MDNNNITNSCSHRVHHYLFYIWWKGCELHTGSVEGHLFCGAKQLYVLLYYIELLHMYNNNMIYIYIYL